MLKPDSCRPCSLYKLGRSFSIPDGLGRRKVILIGEGLGHEEALDGLPFRPHAQAGSKLEQCINLAGYQRDDFYLWNVIACQPPDNKLKGYWYEQDAIRHCSEHFIRNINSFRNVPFLPIPGAENFYAIEQTYSKGNTGSRAEGAGAEKEAAAEEECRVFVALGNTAFSYLVNERENNLSVLDVRGYVFEGRKNLEQQIGKYIVIPSMHPSYIKRGNGHLTPLLIEDLRKAVEIANRAIGRDGRRKYVSKHEYLRDANYQIVGHDEAISFYYRVKDSPKAILSYDIETPESGSVAEDSRDDLESAEIVQIQFALDKHRAVIFPNFEGKYRELSKYILELPNLKANHNTWNFDNPRLRTHGIRLEDGKIYDTMWMFKHWQPKLPRGLQTVAAFAGFPFAWKHHYTTENSDVPWRDAGGNLIDDRELYAGADVCSIHFILEWLPPLMKARGIWDRCPNGEAGGYIQYVQKLQPELKKASDAGVPVNLEKWEALGSKLRKMRDELNAELQSLIPDEIRNLKPKRKVKVLDTETGKEFEHASYGYLREPKEIKIARYEYEIGSRTLQTKGRRVKPFESFLRSRYGLVLRRVRDIDSATGDWIELDRYCKIEEFKASKEQLSRYIRWKRDTLAKSQDKLERRISLLYEVPKDHEGNETTRKGEIEILFERTGDEVLQKNLEIRSLSTNINNYLPNWKPKSDGNVHTTFGYSAASGQLDARSPNILNCSKHTPVGQLFRRIIEAPKGYTWVECVVPGTKLLTWGLDWIAIENLKKDDLLVGFDEEPSNNVNRPYRALRKSTVVNSSIIRKKCVKIVTTMGNITCSKDHLLVSRGVNSHSDLKKARGWRKAGDIKIGHTISFFTRPWEYQTSREAGYIAGFMDGEGWVSNLHAGYGQNDGKLADSVDSMIRSYGFSLAYSVQGRTNFSDTAGCIKHDIQHEEAFGGLRFIGMFKPERLLTKLQNNLEGTAVWGRKTKAAVVLSVEEVGEQDVIALETTSHTYIAEGFLSHNCDKKSFHVATMGYCANDRDYIRFSQLDPHSIFTSFIMPKDWGEPVDMAWSDSDILARCKEIKKRCKIEKEKDPILGIDIRQQQAKPCVLGNQLELGPRKLWWQNRRSIKSQREAERLQAILASMFPKVMRFKESEKEKLARQTYLLNEFGYIFHAFDVINWRWNKRANAGMGDWEKSYGEEGREGIAFRVQGAAFGMIKDELFRILHRLQQADIDLSYYPFRNTIHDSLMFLFRDEDLDRCIPICLEEMSKPCGKLINEATGEEGLRVGVEYSVGKNWQAWHKHNDNCMGIGREIDRGRGCGIEENLEGMREV